ncbi:hypothetical protein EKJ_01800 [Qipengyuania flava]|uniref:Uncharacterized protein n=1 Tax=Qipengyuania flava TaxID=192812 RepID=A0A3T1CEG8_9SPHN|nr:hypothetical protein [Qipengyuania flava]BBI19333.1 hypothetical protein EKJ_01800 [Qipengyuania flava]
MDQLRDFGIEPRTVGGPYGKNIDRLVADILATNSPFVICDYRLQPKNLASFNGSRVIQALRATNKPAMLMTMFQSNNRLELREARADIPLVVGRGEFDVEMLAAYAEICTRELSGDPVDERRAHRTLIEIKDIRNSGGDSELDVVIPNWRPDQSIILPTQCVANGLIARVEPGDFLLGDVNVGANNEDDLFFRNVDEIVKAAEIADL